MKECPWASVGHFRRSQSNLLATFANASLHSSPHSFFLLLLQLPKTFSCHCWKRLSFLIITKKYSLTYLRNRFFSLFGFDACTDRNILPNYEVLLFFSRFFNLQDVYSWRSQCYYRSNCHFFVKIQPSKGWKLIWIFLDSSKYGMSLLSFFLAFEFGFTGQFALAMFVYKVHRFCIVKLRPLMTIIEIVSKKTFTFQYTHPESMNHGMR